MAKRQATDIADNPIPEETPEEALGFREPDISGDEVTINGAPRMMDVPAEPMGFNLSPPVGGNAPAQGDISQQIMSQMNSPEYKQKLQMLAQRGQGALEEQKRGLGENEALLNEIKQNKINPAPLYSMLGPGMNNVMPGYVNPDERNAMLLKLNSLIQAQRGALSKDEIAFMKEQLAGPQSPLNTMKQLAQMDYYKRYAAGGPVEQLQEQRFANQAREHVLGKLATDKDSTQRLAQYKNLHNLMSNMADAKTMTPQQVYEFQQGLRRNLGITGTSGVGEREETYINSLGLKGANFRQFLTGDPQDVSKDTKLLGHLQDLAKNEQNNISNQYGQRLKAISSGYSNLLSRHPEVLQDINEAVDNYGKQLELPPVADVAKPKVKAPTAKGAPEIGAIEDGHRYKGGDPANKDSWEEVK